MNLPVSFSEYRWKLLYLPTGITGAILIGWLSAKIGLLVPGLLITLAILVPFIISLFKQPRVGLVGVLIYCFLLFILDREIGDFPYGIVVDTVLLLTWIAVAFNRTRYNWQALNNDLCLLSAAWFVLNILELGNPAGASPAGWFQEMRSTTLYWFLSVPLAFLFFRQKKDLNLFLILIISLSVLGSLNGLKQLYLGLSPGEQVYLEANAKTHLLWGKLRVFSFYSDAGQFGASQAHLALVSLILALGPFKTWKRILLFAAAGILLIGMLISGTRGALFALVFGIAVALFISKNIKIFILGSVLAFGGLFILKYTDIGNGNYQVYRMRTALDPKDASLNVRLNNQQILRNYLSTRPFGGGVGVMGTWGNKYNADKFLSTIPPDSYWVKVWGMYGIVGFIIWFGINLYILGKCCGIVWKIRDEGLRIKLIALTAGAAGILICSYGNEVINFMPSSIIIYLSWVFVFLGPKLDSPAPQSELVKAYV